MTFEKIKSKILIQNLLLAFIVLCPILDIASFLFRKFLGTSISISTFLRPIIPIIAAIYIFAKEKDKKPIIAVALAYFIYAVCHMYVFWRIKPGCAYSDELHEMQYIINYTFMILNLIIYWKFLASKNRNDEVKDEEKGRAVLKIRKCALISLTIYVLSIYVAILTKTSSFTYEETMTGYKGWFESGNSIGTIILLLLFIVLPMLSKKYETKYRIWTLMITILSGTYLTTLLGTRTGLFGFIVVIGIYAGLCILKGILNNKKLNKKIILTVLIAIAIIAVAVLTLGSNTLKRRKQLKENEDLIYDPNTNATAHVTGDIMQIVIKAQNGQIDENYMPQYMQDAYIKLYEMANEKNISNTNMRMLQLIYHANLVKEQNNIPMLLFGNGYMSHFYEMILEMEIPAFLYNFGIVGFFMYFMPFLFIAMYGIYEAIKNIKRISIQGLMAIAGLWFAIMASLLSGYTFFNSSSMIVIVILSILVVNEMKDLDDEVIKIYKPQKGKTNG